MLKIGCHSFLRIYHSRWGLTKPKPFYILFVYTNWYPIWQVLISIYINYTLEVFEWTTATSGITLALVGVTVALTAPYFCARYTEACLYFFGLLVQCCAYIMLAVAGSGIDSKTAMAIGVPGIFLISIGGFFISTMQALITAQYAKDRQGECSGVISQLSLVTTIPSYGIGLLFSYTLSSDASFYWPGISYAMVRFLCPVKFYYNLDKNYYV